MTGWRKKLDHWQTQGLITTSQVQAIAAYEENQPSAARFLWRFGLLGLGILAIALGLIAIVSSNWGAIPVALKLGVHIVLNVAVAGVLIHWYRQGQSMLWRFEALLLLLAVLILTLIALIGQILQTQSDLDLALRVWWVLVTPMILLLGRTRLSFLLWTILTVTALTTFQKDFFDHVPVMTALLAMPALFVGLAPISFWRSQKPGWADFGETVMVIVSVVLMQLMFFETVEHLGGALLQAVAGSLLVYGVFLGARFRLLGLALRAVDKFILFQMVLALIVLLTLPDRRLEALTIGRLMWGAWLPILWFVIYWSVVGLIGVYHDRRLWVSVAVAALAGRIVLFFFDVFESLMVTGLILMVTGVGLIYLIKTYPRWRRVLMRHIPGAPQ